MTIELLISLLGLVGSLFVIVGPIIKLSNNIAILDTTIKNTLQKLDDVKKMTDQQEIQLKEHEQKIIKNTTTIEDHERRITKLEK
jgi:Tfp pilus assembly protein PilN